MSTGPSPAPARDSAAPLAPAKTRDLAVDLLRGVVMVLMALDHARDYFGDGRSPTDLAHATPLLFFTRWITHFCAPVFVFLAGTAVELSASRGKPRRELARFLVTRGLWLVLLELTVVRFAWTFDYRFRGEGLQVIWAIGWSMVALAGLVYLPRVASLAVGLSLILFHNLADGLRAASFGRLGWLWAILHEPHFGYHPAEGFRVSVIYPLVPWIGVMAVGHAAGAWVRRPERRALFFRAGLAVTLGFFALRAAGVYGDARGWVAQPTLAMTIASFFNCTKYPPSLLYLAMTLGPAMLALAAASRTSAGTGGAGGRLAEGIATIGRVPLFYYVAHILLIHLVASSFLFSREGWDAFTEHDFFGNGGAGFSLAGVYAAWLAVVLALYPACRWFAGVKARRRDAWLSYL